MLSNDCSPRVRSLLSAMHRHMVKGERRVARAVLSPEEYLEKEELRVASLRETRGLPTVSRRAEALRYIAQRLTPQMGAGELIAGSQQGNNGWQLATVGSQTQLQRQSEIHQAYRALGIGFGGIEQETTAKLRTPGVVPRQRDVLNAVCTSCPAARETRSQQRHHRAGGWLQRAFRDTFSRNPGKPDRPCGGRTVIDCTCTGSSNNSEESKKCP